MYVSVATKTQDLDLIAFEKVKHFLGDDFGDISMLVLTHGEQLGEDRFKEVVADLGKFKQTKSILDYCKLGVFLYGTMNNDNLQTLSEGEEALAKTLVLKTLNRVERMRKHLCSAIAKSATVRKPIWQLEAMVEQVDTSRKETLNSMLAEERQKLYRVRENEIKDLNEKMLLMQQEFDLLEKKVIKKKTKK